MTKFIATRFGIALLLLAFLRSGSAEDIDIFGQAGVIEEAPNILFILDNSANWSRAAQQWPAPSDTQGEAELLAIASVLANLETPLNVGLVMLTNRNEIGGYVRFGVRPMLLPDGAGVLQPTDANVQLRAMLTEIASKVNDPTEQVPQAQDGYANALYETWLYLQGVNSWAGMDPKADFAGNNTANTVAALGLDSGWAYAGSADRSRYNPPIAEGTCGSTYIVFIGNNRAPGGGAGSMPYVPQVRRNAPVPPAIAVLQQYNYTTPAESTLQATWARFLRNRPDLGAGTPAAAAGGVVTYAIDAYNAQQNPTFTTMMRDMAQVGGGKYFKANSDDELLANLEFIVNEVQAKNSVFAAVSLPVSVNQRGTFLNQVYLGVFRPDRLGAPNWPGNLKLYQIAVNTNTDPPTLFLADKDEVPAASASTGFISPGVTSFWSTPSDFWATNYFGNSQGVGGPSDAPDGDLVEKGGVAQRLRIAHAANQDARSVYTCTGACASGSLLSLTPFATDNDDVLAGDPDRTAIINWVRGANNMGDENPLPSPAVRGFLHGDVLHSRPAVVNYGGDPGEEVVYVYYGSNDGMLHAVRGGPNVADGGGTEEWAFIAPEHFGQFSRMRLHAPPISPAARKPYFIDGSATAYTKDVNNDKVIDVDDGDKAYLFLTMRRGGRYIYALDITDPTAPRMLWKRTNESAGFEELGQTWSDLRVARIRANNGDPVLIFGLGYDPLGNDSVVPGAITSGRGVMVLDALTGDKIWASSDAVGRNGIDHSVAATVAPVDTDGDGLVDRIIAADTGANVWRINIDDADPADWTVAKVASLGTGAGAGARRFINGPDVVLAGQGDPQWDSILIGSGDREQPFDVTVANRFYMIKDQQAKNYVWPAPLTEADLYDATDNLVQDGTAAEQSAARVALAGTQGWYIRLGEGEKVVGPSTTLSGTTFFGTNTPIGEDDAACGDPGTARNYAVSFKDATATIRRDGVLDASDRSAIIPGGGLPPAPVALQVEIDGQIYQAVAFGTQILQPPGTAFGRRFRSWWYQPIDR
jgi:type IV pilus assembly protein PilY1